MTPFVGMLTEVLTTAAVVWAIVRISQEEIGSAVARWIQSRHGGIPEGPDTSAELARVRDRVDTLQLQLEEAQERLDFAERMLVSGRRDYAGAAPDR
jgi:hypothetical protein